MLERVSTLHKRSVSGLRSLVIAGMTVALVAGLATTAAEAATSAAIVVDAKTGKVLYASNADARCYPASLTKMMTLYLLFEALDSGKTTLASRIKISQHAAAQPPSKLGLKPGQTIAVKDAILSIVTRSANDIAAAIGEYLAGSETAFAVKMTAKARALGMKNTTFRNASGLPNPSQVTTARDMALLGRALQDRFPTYYAYFKTPSFTYGKQRIANHNRLLGRVAGVDGIKTGYTRASGFNLVTSVNRDNKRVVAVVLGGKSGTSRDQRMASLISDYMSKASAGSRTVALAASAEAAVASAIPVPRARPDSDGDTPIETGSVAVASVIVDDSNGEGDVDDEDGVAPAAAPPVKAAVTARAVTSGWKIQIAATPTQAAALDVLAKARAKAPNMLSTVTPHTEIVVKGSTTLYRARFVGFADKKSAHAACAFLTRQEFACLAIAE